MLPFFMLESPLGNAHKQMLEMQITSMENALDMIDRAYIHHVSNGLPVSHICDWGDKYTFYQECSDGILKTLSLKSVHTGPIAIEFLPGTIEDLRLIDCRIDYPIETRFLPKSAREIRLNLNSICGTFNLQTLPSQLIVLDLSNNCISGPIFLIDLPQTMKILIVQKNSIRQSALYYKSLPVGIQTIDLTGNQIERLEAVDDDKLSEQALKSILM